MEAQELRPLAAAAQVVAAPAAAQVAPEVDRAAAALVPVLAGKGDLSLFAPSFRQAVPDAQFAGIAAQLRGALGEPQSVASTTPDGPWSATVVIGYARGTATMRLTLDAAPPHQIVGLLVTGTSLASDTPARLLADVRALPGAAGFGVYRLGGPNPVALIEAHGEDPAPLGSAFKLWLLAELSRQVRAGERHWADVVPIGAPSLPSGVTQNWPAGTPATLQSLATMMIAISDNTAADTLLTVLGRDKVEAMVTRAGAAHPERTLPLLSTREAFVLKGDPVRGAAWVNANLPARRKMLADLPATLPPASLFAGKPVASESVEWFASPADMARLLDWLRVRGDSVTHAILAANAGTDPATRERFGYVGFKGGAEPGVITLNYLVQTRAGEWLAVTGNWHRTDADTPVVTFATLMNRALVLAASSHP